MVFQIAIKLITDTIINCTNGPHGIPSASSYLSELNFSFVVALMVSTIVSLATVCLGIIHIYYAIFYVTQRNRRTFVIYLASTAPFVSLLALVAMYMPRVWFLAHLLGFLYFSIALWVIICLLMNLFEGRQKMVRKMKNGCSKIRVRTPPFCCFFPCLPSFELQQKRIRFCEMMVLQAPCIRLVFTILSLILYFEYQDGAFIALKILDLISLPSLLIGIYGTHILVTTVSVLDELMPYRYIVVFRLLDFYFMFFGVQQPIFDFLARAGVFGCGTVLPSLETAFFWKNSLIVIESFLVSLISTTLLKPSQSALFDKYPSYHSAAPSVTTAETGTDAA